MPTQLQSQYSPITGEEGRQALKSSIGKKIDLMPMMKKGHAYNRFKADGHITISAYPSDVPVPEVDFKALTIDADVEDKMPANFTKVLEQIDFLEKAKINLQKRIERIDATLATIRPQEVIEVALDAGNKPDELRVQEGLSVPMIERTGSGMREVHVPAEKAKEIMRTA